MAIELDPRFASAHADLARSLEALRRFDEARAAYEAGRGCRAALPGRRSGWRISRRPRETLQRRGAFSASSPRRERSVSCRRGESAPCTRAWGDIDEAYRWLEIAVQEKASGLILLRVHPRLDPIRSDARYWPLVRRVGLDDSAIPRTLIALCQSQVLGNELPEPSQQSHPQSVQWRRQGPHVGPV
jgi:hypothetical protein